MYRIFAKVGMLVSVKDEKVVPEWRGIKGYIYNMEKYSVFVKIIKGNRYHRKGGKLLFFPCRLLKKEKNAKDFRNHWNGKYFGGR